MSKNKSQNKEINGRDPKSGQFQLGHTGMGGRPKGSRDKLGQAFVADLHDGWLKHGKDVIERVVRDDPAQFLKTISHVLPKELNAELVNVNLSLFAEVENVNQAYRIAMDYLHGKIKADDEPVVIEASNGGE
jgi:hypothetical protein